MLPSYNTAMSLELIATGTTQRSGFRLLSFSKPLLGDFNPSLSAFKDPVMPVPEDHADRLSFAGALGDAITKPRSVNASAPRSVFSRPGPDDNGNANSSRECHDLVVVRPNLPLGDEAKISIVIFRWSVIRPAFSVRRVGNPAVGEFALV